jgi:hypothetical protein
METKKLVEECEERLKVRWNGEFIRLAWYSFLGKFGPIREGIREDMAFDDHAEVKRFIEICDNRIKRAGTFLNEVAMVLGFALTALTIIAAISSDRLKESGDPILSIIGGNLYSIQFKILVIFLFVALIFLIILLAHYRTHVHAWTAFKEEAILNENYLPQSPTQTSPAILSRTAATIIGNAIVASQ